MKSAKDPRHKRRQKAIKDLFANTYSKQDAEPLAKDVMKKQKKLDEYIVASAPQWPIEKLNRIDLSILRLATYELHHTETPPKVVIDEAVELAKEFGGENSGSFVNGVLGNILKLKEESDTKNEKDNS